MPSVNTVTISSTGPGPVSTFLAGFFVTVVCWRTGSVIRRKFAPAWSDVEDAEEEELLFFGSRPRRSAS